MTVADALTRIRRTGVNKETIYTCYVTSGRKLLGAVSVKDLLLAEEDLEDWVFEDGATESFLAARPGPLRRVCEFEQLAFHFE
jgi:hypothetical protein